MDQETAPWKEAERRVRRQRWEQIRQAILNGIDEAIRSAEQTGAIGVAQTAKWEADLLGDDGGTRHLTIELSVVDEF